MLPSGSPPRTYAEWRRIKAATRYRQFLERQAAADEASADAWLAAVARDDATDPANRKRQELAGNGTPNRSTDAQAA